MFHRIENAWVGGAKIKELAAGDKLEMPICLSTDENGNHLTIFIGDGLDSYPEVAKTVVRFTVPEGYNVTAALVKAIDGKIESLAETYHREVGELRERKAQLLQISYGGNDVLDAVTGGQSAAEVKEDDDGFPF